MRTLIIGAGLTGLTAGLGLAEDGVDALIVDRANKPGGLAGSYQIGPVTFDLGVHIFYFRQDRLREKFVDILQAQALRAEKKVRIHMDDHLVEYPYQANLHSVPLEQRINLLADFCEARRDTACLNTEPKNFKQWLIAEYGQGIAEAFLIPHNEKLMQLDLEKVSTAWPKRFFPKPDAKQILRGAFEAGEEQFHDNQYFLYPSEGGCGRFASDMAASLADRLPIECGRTVMNIDVEAQVAYFEDGSEERYERLISTIPLPELFDLVDPEETWSAGVRHRMQYCSLGGVFLHAKRQCELARKGVHWLYHPQPEIPFQRMSFMENFSPANAPVGESGICLECTLPAGSPLPANLEDECLTALKAMGITRHREIMAMQTVYVKYAYPIFHDAWDEDMDYVARQLGAKNILSTGRNGAWKYSNMEDALRWGENAAKWAVEGE